MSLVQRAAAMHFELSPEKPNHTDVLELKIHFSRPTLTDEIIVYVHDVSIGKQISTIEVKACQGGKLQLIGLLE